MLPMIPGAGFCSSKLALRALAEMSVELRFWPTRPANLPEPAEDCEKGGYVSCVGLHGVSEREWEEGGDILVASRSRRLLG